MKKIWIFPLVLVVSFVIWMKLIDTHEESFGAQSIPFQRNILFAVYGFLVTLIGVLLGSAYRELQALKVKGETHINIGKFFAKLFTAIDLWIGLVGAPIVFALLWKSLQTVSVPGLTVVALQNGFCCTIIIANLMKSQENPREPDPKKPE